MRKVISLMLAIVMAMSMTSVAFADDASDGYPEIELSEDAVLYKETMDALDADSLDRWVYPTTLKNICVIPEETTFTVSNDDCKNPVYIYFVKYSKRDASTNGVRMNEVLFPYVVDIDEEGNEIPYDVTGKYVQNASRWQLKPIENADHHDDIYDRTGKYVWRCQPGAFYDPDCVLLEKGESVTFGLPSDAQTGEDIIYTLYAEYYNSETDYYSWSYVNFIVDDDLYASLQKENTDTVEGLKFTDVKNTDYFAEAVKWAVEKGITNGTSETTFSPYATCTRGQLMTVFWRAAGSPEPKGNTNPFADVKDTAYYYKAVQWAVENGITNGTSATTFSPDATCTHAQALTLLWRYAGSPTIDGTSSLSEKHTGEWYKDAIVWADLAGILNDTNTLVPSNACPRADMVTYLWRKYNTVYKDYAKYDGTTLVGAEVVECVEALRNENIAVLISTLQWQHEKNNDVEGDADNHPIGAYTNNSYSNVIEITDPVDDSKQGLYFLGYYNLPENVGEMPKVYFDGDCYRSENGIIEWRNEDTSNLYVPGHKEFIPSGAQYKCYLLKDLNNNVIGVTFQGVKTN